MSGKLPSLIRRLAKIEQQLIDEAWAAELPNCICQKMTVADAANLEEFKAEMDKKCPAHGFRDLGLLVQVEYAGLPESAENAKLHRLLEIYKARRPRRFSISQLRQAGLEI